MARSHFIFGVTLRTTLPSEFENEASLLKHLDVSPAELKKIWWRRADMYSNFDISKSSGKSRFISAPDKRLKMIQRKVATSLGKIYRLRDPVHGFAPNRSIKTNAETHLRRRYVLNIDLKDFFGAISERRVQGLLRSLGLDSTVSNIISRICCNQGRLPQGAPSSPIISNMICFRLDKSLMDYAKSHRLLYTRYADDITLSGFQPLSAIFDGSRPNSGKLNEEILDEELKQIIHSNGFELNSDKIHYSDKNSRRMVTGIKVNEGLNIDRRYIRNLRAIMYRIEKDGVEIAQKEFSEKYFGRGNIQSYIQGKISWVGFIKGQSDPVFRGLATRYNRCFSSGFIKIHPTPEESRERAIWVLEHDELQGTAFFLKGIGLVTAAHCVEGASNIALFHPTKFSNRFDVTIASICPGRDLAVLNHPLTTTEFFELTTNPDSPNVGEETVAVGYPHYGYGDKLNYRPGSISSLTTKHAVKLIEVTQKLAQGMSGGPLLNEENQVIGIIHKGGPKEPRDFAVSISELESWVTSISAS